jgi:hypothetical protein
MFKYFGNLLREIISKGLVGVVKSKNAMSICVLQTEIPKKTILYAIGNESFKNINRDWNIRYIDLQYLRIVINNLVLKYGGVFVRLYARAVVAASLHPVGIVIGCVVVGLIGFKVIKFLTRKKEPEDVKNEREPKNLDEDKINAQSVLTSPQTSNIDMVEGPLVNSIYDDNESNNNRIQNESQWPSSISYKVVEESEFPPFLNETMI